MPRIAPGVAVVVIVVGCIGFNIHRYPAVWEMAAEADRPIRLGLAEVLEEARQSEGAKQSEEAGQTSALLQPSIAPQASGILHPASISQPMHAASSAKYGALVGQATPRAATPKHKRAESPKVDEPPSEQQESAKSEAMVFQRPLVAVGSRQPTREAARADDSAASQNRLASRGSHGDRFGVSTSVPAVAANAAREDRRLTRPISLREPLAVTPAVSSRPTVRRLPPVDQVAPLPEPRDQLPWSGDVIPIYPTTGIQ